MADDILANGLHIPITVVETTTYATEKDKKGVTTYQLLDGRNRLDACDLAGVNLLSDPLHNCGIVKVFEIKQDGKTRIIAHKPINVRKQSVHMWRSDVQEQIDKNDAENRAHVASINIHRRHLTVEERQDLLIELVALSPEKSDRQHAKEAGVDHKTIGKARAKGEQLGKVPQLGKRTGTDGKARKQPTKKTATKKTTKSAEAKALANVIKNATAAADNLAKANGIEPPKPPAPSRNDVGPSSTGEIQRKLARLEELEPEVVKLRQQKLALESEVEELKAAVDLRDDKIAKLESQIKDLTKSAQATNGEASAATVEGEILAGNDPGPIPDFLLRPLPADAQPST